jgi:hypothetical protein
VLDEVTHWMTEGISLFAQQWQPILENDAAALPNTS